MTHVDVDVNNLFFIWEAGRFVFSVRWLWKQVLPSFVENRGGFIIFLSFSQTI